MKVTLRRLHLVLPLLAVALGVGAVDLAPVATPIALPAAASAPAVATILPAVPVAPVAPVTPAERVKPVNPASGFRAVPEARPGRATHVDPAPAGVDVTKPVSTDALLRAAATYQPTGTPVSSGLVQHVTPYCGGTGTDGNRLQAIYAVAQGATNRYANVLGVIRNELAAIDDVFAVSAAETGGGRRVRWVNDANCQPTVLNLTLPLTALGNDLSATENALAALGYTAKSRKYLVFADANALCGIGDVYPYSQPTNNPNDGAYPMYSRVDTGCWVGSRGSISPAAHELMHTLGSVMSDAPHATDYGHCTDGAEVMCYSDGSSQAQLAICPSSHQLVYDCNHDDYFSTNPAAGSYLATHWNTASSSFLAVAPVLNAAPTIAVAPAPSSLLTGEALTLTASGTAGLSWAWSSSSPTCVVDAPAAATATWTCDQFTPSSVTFTVQGTSPDAQPVSTGVVVAVTKASAPTGSLVASTDSPYNGVGLTLTDNGGGTGPLTYQWDASGECFPGPLDQQSLAVLCPADDLTRTLTVSATTRQGDGQTATVPFTFTVSPPPADYVAPTPEPSAEPTPTAEPVPALVVAVSGPASVEAGRYETYTATANRPDQTWTWSLNRTDCPVVARSGPTLTVRCAFPARGVVQATALATDSATGDSASSSKSTSLILPSTLLRASGVAGRPDRVTARLTRYGGVVPGQVVRLQVRGAGAASWSWATGNVRMASNGTVTVSVQPRTRTSYRWVFATTSAWRGSTSGAVSVSY